MSTYSLASRLVWKKGFSTLRPIILTSSCCPHECRAGNNCIITNSNVSVLVWNTNLIGTGTTPPSKSYSTSNSSTDDKDNDDKTDGINNNVKYDPKQDPFFTQDVAYGSKENKGLGESERPYFDLQKELEGQEIEEEELLPPVDCCQSGCPTCVWVEYVEKLSKRYMNPELGRERILKDLESIENQSIKAFIMLELRTKGLI